jgi:hypothetical protein
MPRRRAQDTQRRLSLRRGCSGAFLTFLVARRQDPDCVLSGSSEAMACSQCARGGSRGRGNGTVCTTGTHTLARRLGWCTRRIGSPHENVTATRDRSHSIQGWGRTYQSP